MLFESAPRGLDSSVLADSLGVIFVRHFFFWSKFLLGTSLILLCFFSFAFISLYPKKHWYLKFDVLLIRQQRKNKHTSNEYCPILLEAFASIT